MEPCFVGSSGPLASLPASKGSPVLELDPLPTVELVLPCDPWVVDDVDDPPPTAPLVFALPLPTPEDQLSSPPASPVVARCGALELQANPTVVNADAIANQ
jgi:hypothetical protein